jgi:hypothetical protein
VKVDLLQVDFVGVKGRRCARPSDDLPISAHGVATNRLTRILGLNELCGTAPGASAIRPGGLPMLWPA